MNETENKDQLVQLAEVPAPALVPSQEWIGEAVLVQSPEDTGAEDQPVEA